jgi:hypothetical protein
MKKHKYLIFLLTASVFCGCVRSSPQFENRFPAPRAAEVNAADWGSSEVQDTVHYSPADRKKTCKAMLNISIPEPTENGVKKASDIAEKYNGHVTFSNNSSIIVKVPAKKVKSFIAEVEKMGSCTSRTIYSQDVTEAYTDLTVRCQNLSRLLERLSALLKKAEKIEDILRIEKEIARVTGEMERLKGKLNVMQNQISMSEISINFSTDDNPDVMFIMPFPWMREIGIPRPETGSENPRLDKFQIRLIPPKGFVTIFSQKTCFKAVDGQETVLRARIHNNLPGGDAAYCKKLLQRQFKTIGYEKISVEEIQLADGIKALAMTAERKQDSCYLLVAFYESGWLFKDQKILVAEFIGQTTQIKLPDIKKWAKSLVF